MGFVIDKKYILQIGMSYLNTTHLNPRPKPYTFSCTIF
jgi:hypothetical protein